MNKKIYFPNLNGLRFIAAFAVVIAHTEQFKSWLGYKNYFDNHSVNIIGKLGVLLFFVLSGFLITYLLMIEKKETNAISVKNFYVRRMFRIWPLYYLIVFLSFFVFVKLPFLSVGYSDLPSPNLIPKLLLALFVLPNIQTVLYGAEFYGFYSNHTWSIGVEEQFYLIWPFILRKVKKLDRFLILFVVGYNVIKMLLVGLVALYPQNIALGKLYYFYFQFSIDCMAIGGLFACLHFNKSPIIDFLFSKKVQIINLIVITGLIVFGRKLPYFHYELFSVLFGILILNVATNKKTIVNLEFPVLNYLGKISYGMYIYHLVLVAFSLNILGYFGIKNFFAQYLLIISSTILISGLSFKYFESYFLRKGNSYNWFKKNTDTKA